MAAPPPLPPPPGPGPGLLALSPPLSLLEQLSPEILHHIILFLPPISVFLLRRASSHLFLSVASSSSPLLSPSQLASEASSLGWLSVLRWLVDWDPDVLLDGSISIAACRTARLDVLEWLLAQGGQWSRASQEHEAALSSLSSSASSSPASVLETLRFLHSKGCPFRGREGDLAATHGCLEILAQLHDWGAISPLGSLRAAALAGQQAALEWLVDHGCNEFNSSVAVAAAAGGHLAMLEFLLRRGCAWTSSILQVAASKGHVPILQWALQLGAPFPKAVLDEAIRSDQLPVLLFLLQHNSQPLSLARLIPKFVEAQAVKLLEHSFNELGASDKVDWARLALQAISSDSLLEFTLFLDRGVPYEQRFADEAASSGSLRCLKLILNRRLLLDSLSSIQKALSHAQVGTLKLLCSTFKYSFSLADLQLALKSKEPSLLTFALSQRSWDSSEVWRAVATVGSLRMAEIVLDQGVEPPASAYVDAIEGDNVALLHWLHQNGCPWDSSAFLAAMVCDRVDFLESLRLAGCPWTPDCTTFIYSQPNLSPSVLSWAKRNFTSEHHLLAED